MAIIQATDAPVRWRADGVDPTASVGMVLDAGGEMLYSAATDALAALKFIRTTTGAVLNVTYY